MPIDPLNEGKIMRRIREIDLKLYNEIITIESNLYTEMNARLAELTQVKDLILAYDRKGARQRFKEIKKKNRS